MAPPLLTLKDIFLTFGGTPLLEGAELTVTPGDRLCLVGRNASGKSTLMKIAAGLVEPDRGERFLHPGAAVRYLPQEADFGDFHTTRAYVEAGLNPTDDPHRATEALYDFGFTGDENPQTLSGGEARRVALARVLAPEPDILLLDEPTNHLDLTAIEWLEKKIASLRSAVVLISHDRRFLETLSRATLWLDRGQSRRIERGFTEFESWRDEILEQEETERHKLDRRIVREDQWMHGGVTGRRKRNIRRVRELQDMRRTRDEHRGVQGNVRLGAADAGQSSRLIVEADNISKSFGGLPVINGFSTRLLRGDRLGIVGPNGAGKTTLLKLLTGQLAPDDGTIRLGASLDLVTLDQRRDELDPNMTVADSLTGGRGDHVTINGASRHVASYMKDFLFLPEQRRTPLRVLSGGERGRLMLARALAKPSNVLVLDEPTNDLDLETLDLLQELLADYPGTVLLVSHDRDFLDRVVTSVIAPDGDGRWIEYAGGYSDMLAQRRGATPEKAQGKRSAATASAVSKASPSKQRESVLPSSSASENEATAASTPEPEIARRAQRKLSFKQKHALETLPAQIEKLHSEMAALGAKLADASFYARDPKAFDQATRRLAAAQAELSLAEEQWLDLEMQREALEGARILGT